MEANESGMSDFSPFVCGHEEISRNGATPQRKTDQSRLWVEMPAGLTVQGLTDSYSRLQGYFGVFMARLWRDSFCFGVIKTMNAPASFITKSPCIRLDGRLKEILRNLAPVLHQCQVARETNSFLLKS